jgi:16S rRNA U1498 N3-methylase RsmE
MMGDFENEEVKFTKSPDIQNIRLRDSILRVETSAVVAYAPTLNYSRVSK